MILGWKEPLYLAARDEEADRIRGEMEELTGGAGAAKRRAHDRDPNVPVTGVAAWVNLRARAMRQFSVEQEL